MGRATNRIVFRRRISTPWGELRMRSRSMPRHRCQVHEWPTHGMARRLVHAMKDRHPRGIDACPTCIERAFGDAKREREEARARR